MAHDHNPQAEAILDEEISVLPPYGFVRLVDYMGGDARIIQAARVSYGGGSKGKAADDKLVGYLWANKHTSPFEQVLLTIHAKMPIFVARQWVRHRTARLNEISGRYSVMKDEFYVPEPDKICYQATANKQGRSGPLPEDKVKLIRDTMQGEQALVYDNYSYYLSNYLAKETARNNLPLSLYTEWYWNIDLHNLLHFLSLRMDSHAQYEIRVYANALFDIAKAVAPVAVEAFMEHTFEAVTFSRSELALLHGYADLNDAEVNVGLDIKNGNVSKEVATFHAKLAKARDIAING